MSTINGLPAHVLLVHFVVVLIPVAVVLEIAVTLWRRLRDLLWWAPLVLTAGLVVLVRYTIDAGEWFQDRLGHPPFIKEHADLGATAIWFAIALLVVAVAIAVLHWRERRSGSSTALTAIVAVLAIVVGVASCVQVYRIGDSGSKAVWSDTVGLAPPR
ncbi:hypothetical protein OG921_02360 [Aldersonia sp. NBC_00410]|uniref:DUF2231 domain-containing protein n=1 Tax=Aldersonia sp. NBC_00410 TaxID=2975954 RepID=UPI002259BD93|nr:DUF2231 domain-containing protein [Aldersonia sp. NBC_00410]MCX5042038.1 hypothetical protein [Aldersonia sp. NBC_00410]